MEDEEEAAAKTKEEVEAEISRAMRARVSDFKERADTLTLGDVRRALEKDLGMKTFSLDAHKRFIKQCLDECFYGANDENVTKISGETASQSAKEEKSRQAKDNKPPDESRKSDPVFNEQIEDSPGSGGKEPLQDDSLNNQSPENNSDLNEDKIRKAIQSRADYFRANSESISLVEVRRLLEEDLKLEKKALDAYRRFITEELDKALQPPEVVKPTNGVKKLKKVSRNIDEKKHSKGSKRAREESDSSDTNDSLTEDEEVVDEVRPKKRLTEKVKAGTKGPKRQKKSKDKNKSSSSSERKIVEQDSENISEDDGGNSSEDSHSNSSKADVKKKQEKPTQVYGKRVEQLKSIIKSCGMSIPPSVYRRAKQVTESKREAYLIKELEDILKKEGLTTNPSEKEIKAVRKKKERARELEGIDMSNIVSSSRRRTASSYIPPTPKIEVESDEDEEEGENEEDSDDDNEDEVSGEGEGSDEGEDEGDEDESD